MEANRKDSCFETCLAYILGIEELEVPFFTKDDPEKWLTNAREWIAKRGLYSIYTAYVKDGLLTQTGAPFIACGASPNSTDPDNPHGHAVVMRLDEVIFDTADGIVGDPEYAIYIFSPHIDTTTYTERREEERAKVLEGAGDAAWGAIRAQSIPRSRAALLDIADKALAAIRSLAQDKE